MQSFVYLNVNFVIFEFGLSLTHCVWSKRKWVQSKTSQDLTSNIFVSLSNDNGKINVNILFTVAMLTIFWSKDILLYYTLRTAGRRMKLKKKEKIDWLIINCLFIKFWESLVNVSWWECVCYALLHLIRSDGAAFYGTLNSSPIVFSLI